VSQLLNTFMIFGAAEESEGIAALGIDPLAILAQAGTFLVLFFIVKKFALEKIVASLEKRRQTIEDGLLLGREMEAEKAKLDQTVEDTLHKTRAEADKIIVSAQKESATIIKQAEEAAGRKADAMLADAHNKIGEDINKARKDLEHEMRTLVAQATEVIIKEKLDANKDSALIERAIKEVG
jgi:F-type H+-transporting ATPase subunit b